MAKKAKKAKKETYVDKWLKRETDHKREALENASRHFDKDDKLTVNLLEAIYGKESSFGTQRRKRGIKGAAGDFMLEAATAVRMGLTVSKENDQRFDIDDASAASGKYLKFLDQYFSKSKVLIKGLKTVGVKDSKERLKFSVAAFNAGEGRIARAQQLAKKNGKNPQSWEEVSEFLKKAGATSKKVIEILEYVEKVLEYMAEFTKKSKADKKAKIKKSKKIKEGQRGGHWVTIKGQHIFIQE